MSRRKSTIPGHNPFIPNYINSRPLNPTDNSSHPVYISYKDKNNLSTKNYVSKSVSPEDDYNFFKQSPSNITVKDFEIVSKKLRYKNSLKNILKNQTAPLGRLLRNIRFSKKSDQDFDNIIFDGVSAESNTDEQITFSPKKLEDVRDSLAKKVCDYIVRKGVELVIFNSYELSDEQKERRVSELLAQHATNMNIPSLALTEIFNSLHESEKAHPLYKAYTQAYIDSAILMEEQGFINKILVHAQLDSSRKELDMLNNELLKAALFPLERTIYLKERADSGKEVFAQEIIRALAPTAALQANPYPKHRVTEDYSHNGSHLGIVPQIPKAMVTSELISFDASRITIDKIAPDQTASINYSYDKPDGSTGKKKIYEIDGFGSSMFMAKFLGNTDAKAGNLGITRVNGHAYGKMLFTSLDAGCCFQINPNIFKNPKEIINPGLIDPNITVYNFLGQMTAQKYNPDLKEFYKQAAENPQVQRENRITALYVALLPPELYRVFATQYIDKEENPFLSVNYEKDLTQVLNEVSFDTVVEEHLIAKAEEIYKNFKTDNTLFGYFLESDSYSGENIFNVFQNFLVQVDSFYFYKKRDIETALGDQGYNDTLEEMITARFIAMIKYKMDYSAPEDREKILELLEAWNPSDNIFIDPRIIAKDERNGTNKANQIREKSIDSCNKLKTELLSEFSSSYEQSRKKAQPGLFTDMKNDALRPPSISYKN